MMEWQPIETAPKDGTKVLLAYASGNYRVIVSEWMTLETLKNGKTQSRSEYWVTPWVRMDSDPQPTHWMPIPDPPR